MSKYNGSKKAVKTKIIPKGLPKRMDNPNDDYQRKTSTKLGKQTMWYIKKDDFEKLQRECLVRKQKAAEGSNEEYRWNRNYLLLMAGTNLGCRTSTIIELTPRNFAGGKFYVKEHKTGKVQTYDLPDKIYKLLKDFVDEYKFTKDEFIFRTNRSSANKPMCRQTAWRFVKKLADDVGIEYNVGAYSLRKSYARWLYDDCHDIFKVMRVLQHSDPIVTARYICLEEEEVQKIRAGIEYGFDKFN
jgi:integrase